MRIAGRTSLCLPFFLELLVCPVRVPSPRASPFFTRLSSPSSDVVAGRSTTTSSPSSNLLSPVRRGESFSLGLAQEHCTCHVFVLTHTNKLPYGSHRCVLMALWAARFCASMLKQRHGEVRQYIRALCNSPSLLLIHSSYVRLAYPVSHVVHFHHRLALSFLCRSLDVLLPGESLRFYCCSSLDHPPLTSVLWSFLSSGARSRTNHCIITLPLVSRCFLSLSQPQLFVLTL